MLIYNHINFASYTFADIAAYDFVDEAPVFYQSNVLVNPLSIDMGSETVGLNELWDEQTGEYDEF